MTEITSSKKVRVSIPWRGLLILLLFVGCQKVEVNKFEHPDGLAMQAKGAAGVLDQMQVGETLKLWGCQVVREMDGWKVDGINYGDSQVAAEWI